MNDIEQWRINDYILEDFNPHIGNAEDQDSQVFEGTLEGNDLLQPVGFSTHQYGSILDLVIK